MISDRIQLSGEYLELYKKIKVDSCPYCGSKRFIKHSRYKYTQRYRCTSCLRTFIPSTGTSLHYIKNKDLFIDY